ncbi:hypothetical protein CRUP_028016 [Coryphaenoides rupestris]|nr:hypothetical protein CRUP_028016 [Coryphaenoides rupestris]
MESGALELWRSGGLCVWVSVCGCVCLAVWSSGGLEVWMSGCLELWRSGALEVWMSGCLELWMSGELVVVYKGVTPQRVSDFETPSRTRAARGPGVPLESTPKNLLGGEQTPTGDEHKLTRRTASRAAQPPRSRRSMRGGGVRGRPPHHQARRLRETGAWLSPTMLT